MAALAQELGTAFFQQQQLPASMADTFLEHLCLLDIDSEPITARSTSIVCTIGPASQSVEIFATNPLFFRPVAIALDTKGPEIRTGLIKGGENKEVELVKGSRLIVTTDPAYRDQCDPQTIWVDYANLPKVVKMLESMIKKPRPTRAESSDVANAVLDGADCIMLSGETAKGAYVVEAVRMQHAIAREAEAAMYHQQLFQELRRLTPLSQDPTEVTAIGAVEASFKCCAAAILVLTATGRSAQILSRYRPRALIIAVTRDAQVARQAHLSRGVFPVVCHGTKQGTWAEDVDRRVQFGMEMGRVRGFLRSEDVVIVVTGWRPGAGFTNIMRVQQVP
ncbi:hypothetical protein Chor_005120 [Crotalus horridus]